MRSTLLAPARRWRRYSLLCFITLLLLLALPLTALAHPLGNFTVNRYSRLALGAGKIELYYFLDMAEIPAFQERSRLDRDGDGQFSPVEQEQYLAEQVTRLQENLELRVNGEPANFTLQEQALAFPMGQGGLATLRLSARLVATLTGESLWQVDYRDNNYRDRLGWQEIVVSPGPEVTLLASTAPTEDLSQELRNYPQDLLQAPLTIHQASFRFTGGREVGVGRDGLPSPLPTPSLEVDPVAALITIPSLGPLSVLLALLAAFGWGAAHALTPGHGKTIVAAYLVGSRGTARHALFLGLTTTLTHTLGVFLLGLLTLLASEFILPEQLYPWLGLSSGLLVVALGLTLFRGYLRRLLQPQADHDHHHHDHDHPHHHHHDHSHSHSHDHSHSDSSLTLARASSRTHHSSFAHSHMPPGADGSAITWAGLLALGVSGGLIPCPSALIVMLSAIALQRIGFGLLLIVAFSLGLAGTLTAIGLLWVQARRWLEGVSKRQRLAPYLPSLGRLRHGLPAASALLITLVGVGITIQAFVQTGFLK